ncbi:MAG: IS66 family transposase [Opitutaceae bacterium]|nr:IS66 family transposase [Opitutaceae bacterium]
MRITPPLFEAFLRCPTKCWLRAANETPAGNAYAQWSAARNELCRVEGIKRLVAERGEGECVVAPAVENLKTAAWRLAVDVPVATSALETRIAAIERVPSAGRGQAAQFVPIRFAWPNKLGRHEKLLLAFDALALSATLGRDVRAGKIIHGDDHATLKVKIPALVKEVRKLVEKTAALLASASPPDLVLNRHCAECEFQARCRQKGIEQDDLSLLSSISEQERKKFRGRGIFTATQLSYTFRPRRRPKHLRDKREKYHHSLKALAMREKKTYVVGSPEFKIEGTPVYLDVEALPDSDFYYLIGVRIKTAGDIVHRSFWADEIGDMATIWAGFLKLLVELDRPCLIHYGSFETIFLKQMRAWFGGPPADAIGAVHAIEHPMNLLSVIYAQIYFPAYSNGLKEIAGTLGFKWSEPDASGLRSVVWRHAWNTSKNPAAKDKLVTYNAEDCEALALVERTVSRLVDRNIQPGGANEKGAEVIRTDELRPPDLNRWRKFTSPLSELEFVTKAAHWDYQRDRIYVRSGTRPKRVRRKASSSTPTWRVDKIVECAGSDRCPHCNRKGRRHGQPRRNMRQEILFGRFSLKRRVVQYQEQLYWCSRCQEIFGADKIPRKRGQPVRYDRSLHAYVFYQTIELGIPAQTAAKILRRFFGLDLSTATVALFKTQTAEYYNQTHQQILKRIVSGELVHADETYVSIKGKRAYVWVFTNLGEVAYVYSANREGDLIKATLNGFKGVLVSDFYAVYDSFECPQQKCLIHLVRDLNGLMLDNPYDEELKQIVTSFGQLLKAIIEDVDRRGLKKHFLRKHITAVDRFYRNLITRDYQSPTALTCVDRFERNRNKLFTFLNYDDVPWNNNNAEHAMKAFARHRDVIKGSSTESGIKEYLILLSVCQTCKYTGVDFLDFLRSGEKDVHAFAESRRRR